MKNDGKASEYSPDELLKALEICKRSTRSRLTVNGQHPDYFFWRSQRWLDVMEHYGDKKSRTLLATIEGINDDFRNFERDFLLNARNDRDHRTAFDWREPLVNAFRKRYPNVPSKLLSLLEFDFAHRHR